VILRPGRRRRSGVLRKDARTRRTSQRLLVLSVRTLLPVWFASVRDLHAARLAGRLAAQPRRKVIILLSGFNAILVTSRADLSTCSSLAASSAAGVLIGVFNVVRGLAFTVVDALSIFLCSRSHGD